MERWNPRDGKRSSGKTAAAGLFLLLAAAVIAGGCSGDEASGIGPAEPREHRFEGKPPIRAVATTGMIADLVAAIGGARAVLETPSGERTDAYLYRGESIEVEALMGEGTDPHLYNASPTDVKKLAAADIIFYNGLHLEGRMADTFKSLAGKKPVLAIAESLPADLLRSPPEFEGQHDPHVWFDVSLWKVCGERVRDALCEFDPPRAEHYRERARVHLEMLEALDREVHDRLSGLKEKTLITAHDAFGYFGRRYGFTVVGIQGISTDSEAGVRRIRELVDLLVEKKIPAVFVESSVDERNIRALIEGARHRGSDVQVGGRLFSDAMGKPGTPEGTYRGMVIHNVETIAKAMR